MFVLFVKTVLFKFTLNCTLEYSITYQICYECKCVARVDFNVTCSHCKIAYLSSHVNL